MGVHLDPATRPVEPSLPSWLSSCPASLAALVVPEHPAAEEQEQREDRKLGRGDALLTAVAVVPGEDHDDRQADQQSKESRAA